MLVLVGGGAYYLETKNAQYPVPVTSQSTLSYNSDPTANWTTYTDSKNSYSIKYPPTLTNNGIGTFSLIKSTIPAAQFVLVSVFNNPKNLSFLDWAKSTDVQTGADTGLGFGNILSYGGNGYNPLEIIINGIKWLNFKDSKSKPLFPPNGYYYWATLANNKVYLIGELNIDYSTTQQVVNTFTFINQNQTVDTSNWKTLTYQNKNGITFITFQNSNGVISLQFPTTWQVETCGSNILLNQPTVYPCDSEGSTFSPISFYEYQGTIDQEIDTFKTNQNYLVTEQKVTLTGNYYRQFIITSKTPNAIEHTGNYYQIIMTAFPKGNITYFGELDRISKESPNYTDAYNQMLQTFTIVK